MTPERNGKKWSVDETLQLQREYRLLNLSIEDIARKHKRSNNAIILKLQNEESEFDLENNEKETKREISTKNYIELTNQKPTKATATTTTKTTAKTPTTKHSPNRCGNKWTVNEILRLQREYELLGLSVEKIASLHGRSLKAINYKIESEGFVTNSHREFDNIILWEPKRLIRK